MNTRAILCGALLAATTPAQDGFDEIEKQVRWKLDERGRVMISPAPSAGGATESFDPVVRKDLLSALGHATPFGIAGLLFGGDTDFASLADCEAFFTRLERTGDAALLQCIAARDLEDEFSVLERLLAVRLAQDRGLKPAIGVLDQVAATKDLDPHLRRAAREAAASLRGEALATPVSLPPLGAVLRDAPAQADVYACIAQHRLPPSRPLFRLARSLQLETLKRAVRDAGGSFSPAMWAGARLLAATPGVLPYEIARRFGNARVHRVVAAVELPKGNADLRLWVQCDGIFDPAKLRRGLQDADLHIHGDDDLVLHGLPSIGDLHIVATANRIRIFTAGWSDSLGDAGAALAGELESSGAPITALVAPRARVPEPLTRFGRPRRLDVWIPRHGTEVRARVVGTDAWLAKVATATRQDLARLAEGWTDRTPALQPVEAFVGKLRVETEGATVDVRADFAGLDLHATLLELVRAGILD